MQDIENDMDDLFRRAAEEYPLHTGSGNWDSVKKRLSVSGSSNTTDKPERKNNRKLLLLLLLLAISLVIGFVILMPGSRNYPADKSPTQTSQQSLQKDKTVPPRQPAINTAPRRLQRPAIIVSTDEKKQAAGATISTKEKKVYTATLRNNTNRNDRDRNISSNKVASQFLSEIDKTYQQNAKSKERNSSETGNAAKYSEPQKDSLLAGNQKTDTGLKKEVSSNNNLLSPEKKKNDTNKKSIKEHSLYAGIIAGTDYSKVKSSSFKEPGFNLGIAIGYKIKSFFVETGISRGLKYYSSQGNMFNDHDAPMPSGMIIDNLESRSKILEIPLKTGYHFYKKKNTDLFIAGGASVYIMTKEKNNYNVTMNGTPEKMVGLYEKNNLKIPAVASISIGWEYHLPGLFKLRVEPVLKLPLQGIGVGRLPVTSVGIQLGITKMLK